MKRSFTLSLVALTATFFGFSARSEELTYKSIGEGHMTEDMVTYLFDCRPVTYKVEIEQATDGSAHYRVLAPYGQNFATALENACGKSLSETQYDAEGKRFIEIDATNPDDVIFHRTMTGCDFGFGEIFIGINSSYNVTMKDGVITAPMLGIAIGYGDSNSGTATNRRGKFRIALPDAVLADLDISVKGKGHCMTDRKFEGTLTVGEDVSEVRYSVFGNWQEDEIISAVRAITKGGQKFTPRGEFSYDMDEVSKETIVVVALDDAGDMVGYDWYTYYFIDDDADGWEDCGMAKFTDGFLQDLISNIPSQTTDCMLQHSKYTPSRYRLVNPYSGLKEYPALNEGHEGHNHYIYINAEDPEFIYVEESPIGMESARYGLMRVSSQTYYYLQAGYDIEECKELECGGWVENGVLIFPNDETLMFSMLNFDGGDWYMTDSEHNTSVVLPEGFSFTAGIGNVTAGREDAPAEYYDMRGIRVNAPKAGELYIVRSGSKVTKTVVR